MSTAMTPRVASLRGVLGVLARLAVLAAGLAALAAGLSALAALAGLALPASNNIDGPLIRSTTFCDVCLRLGIRGGSSRTSGGTLPSMVDQLRRVL